MDDGLYIRGQWVAEVDCGLTFRGNDLTKPDSRTASYSSAFTLPDSLVMRDLLAGGEQIDAGGIDRYQQLPAYLVENGEVIFRGAAQLTSFQAGWKLNLVDAVASFFDSIKDKNLSDLDLSRYDHVWDITHRTGFAGATEGVTYPLIDYGGSEPGSMPFDTITPAMYVKTLFGEIAGQAGYTLTGDWQQDKRFRRMALPFVGDLPKNHDQDYVNARQVRVTVDHPGTLKFRSGSPIDVVLPLSILNRPGYQQSQKANYKPDRYVYVVSEDDRIHIEASVTFYGVVKYGAPELLLQVQRNGVSIAEAAWSEAGYLDFLDTGVSLTINEHVICNKGDELRLKIVGSAKTQFASYSIQFPTAPDDMWAAFIPDINLVEGQIWKTAINLPSLSQLELMLSVAKLMMGTYVVDDTRRTVRLITVQDTIDQLPDAVDWSDRVEESAEPELIVQLDPYGRTNYLYWKETDEVNGKRDKISKLGTGDGMVLCNAPNYPAETILFELPFAACAQSGVAVAGYGNAVYIQTRTITPGNSTTASTTSQKTAEPRIVLMDPATVVTVKTKILDSSGDIILTNVTLTGCWWGSRPDGIVRTDTNYCLSFTDLPKSGEVGLITDYFGPLKRILTSPALLNISVVPDAVDIATLDLGKPIRLQRVRAGALDINTLYGIINSLSPYRPGVPCTLTLIKL